MGFGLNIAKGLVTAATEFSAPDTAAQRIGVIARVIDFHIYATQREFAQHIVQCLLRLRNEQAKGTLTLLAQQDISYAEAAIEEIGKIGSNDYAETLASIGIEFSSLRDDAWNLMVKLRGPKLKDAAEYISYRGAQYTPPILEKLLSSGSYYAIDAAKNVFYLRPEASIECLHEILRDDTNKFSISSDYLSSFFAEISHPHTLRPFVTEAYNRRFSQAAVQFSSQVGECKLVPDPADFEIVTKLGELFKAAMASGKLATGENPILVLTAVVGQVEEQFAPEILHDAMYGPA